MGLADHYEDVRGADGETRSQPRQGAPVDIMTSVETTNVDPATVQRLVQRAGVDPHALKCDFTVDRDVPGGVMKGTKCGGLDGEWVIKTDLKQGPVSVTQTWKVKIDGATATGDFTYEDYFLTEVPESRAEGWGTSGGTGSVALQWDGSATMHLVETRHKLWARGRPAVGRSPCRRRTRRW